MAEFNRRKLQVFVSSTYSDLVDERQAAVEAILTAGHIPAGMELFTSGDESQMQVIKQWIDESDVYVLIIGGRYGSIETKTGKSYTHLEYEYALSTGKPLFACVIKESAIEPRMRQKGIGVVETENPKQLKEFRGQVLTRMSKFWEDHKDIKIIIAQALSEFARRTDLVGWVKASTQSDLPALADEIARLSKENSLLRGQIADFSQTTTINGLTFNELRSILDRKDITGFLWANWRRFALAGRHGYCVPTVDIPYAQESCLLGLLEADPDGPQDEGWYYRITESGRVFLNKLSIVKGEQTS